MSNKRVTMAPQFLRPIADLCRAGIETARDGKFTTHDHEGRQWRDELTVERAGVRYAVVFKTYLVYPAVLLGFGGSSKLMSEIEYVYHRGALVRATQRVPMPAGMRTIHRLIRVAAWLHPSTSCTDEERLARGVYSWHSPEGVRAGVLADEIDKQMQTVVTTPFHDWEPRPMQHGPFPIEPGNELFAAWVRGAREQLHDGIPDGSFVVPGPSATTGTVMGNQAQGYPVRSYTSDEFSFIVWQTPGARTRDWVIEIDGELFSAADPPLPVEMLFLFPGDVAASCAADARRTQDT